MFPWVNYFYYLKNKFYFISTIEEENITPKNTGINRRGKNNDEAKLKNQYDNILINPDAVSYFDIPSHGEQKKSMKEHDDLSEAKSFGIISSGVYVYFILITGLINILIVPIDGGSALGRLLETGEVAYFLGNLLTASCFWFIPYYFVVFLASAIVSVIRLKPVLIQSKWFLAFPIFIQLLLIVAAFV